MNIRVPAREFSYFANITKITLKTNTKSNKKTATNSGLMQAGV